MESEKNGIVEIKRKTSATTGRGSNIGGGGGSGGSGAGSPGDTNLPNGVLDQLYECYSIKQRRAGLESFLVASVMFDIWAVCIPMGQNIETRGLMISFGLVNGLLIVVLRIFGAKQYHEQIYRCATYLAWIFALAQLGFQLTFKNDSSPRDSLGWMILLNFLVYVTLAMPFRYFGIIVGIITFVDCIHDTIMGSDMNESYFIQQIIVNGLLLATAAVIGLLGYFLGEAKHRRAFLEAKQSLEVKMVIDEQSAEQERLLLSVLPEHVAVKMRQDLGSDDSEQFKKIYMSRHENVSILYADIVGFTAISSTYSAQDLVKMLNELFARFDRLAEKYHQLRIKILGDCYYCISGAPIERPDHAALCVYMGLSMVKAIKYVQQKTNSPVDMRVGIHTGAILAGILGQRQWQFDVYSRDVELANKMESSGLAGRVHISEKTLGYLSDEFEVEPAFGEKREESLRIAGLKTYFIKKVLKPFVATEPNGDILEDDDIKDNSSIVSKEDVKGQVIIEEIPDKEVDFKERLKMELLSRDRHSELSNETNIFLKFKNSDLETSFEIYREPLSTIPIVAGLIVFLIGTIYSSFVLPSSLLHFIVMVPPMIIITILVILSIAENCEAFPKSLFMASKNFNNKVWVRQLVAGCCVSLVALFNMIDMFLCSNTNAILSKQIYYNNNDENHGSTGSIRKNESILADHSNEIFASTVCLLFPSYFSNFTVLILIATTVLTQLSHVCKTMIMIVISLAHCVLNIFSLELNYRQEMEQSFEGNFPINHSVSSVLIAVTIALAFLARHMEREDRVIFQWKTEVNEQKEKANDMRQRNEALVYNILPVHVAEHFMRNKTRSYDELYSQSYEEVGVLFASMPNFSDFYSEDTVNNQGLECLRFLNEVISDFDALLEVPKFQDVIKIKTIGSTYMAASGLNPTRQYKPEDSITVRWEHLAILVEFALELKKALQCINEQSFNHFVLKMGINHGPITAGVIGARKPHYDIWGNTVNVASRMESTGKAGSIQVTEETCEILQTFEYTFEHRGLVSVKGKGQLMTFYLQEKSLRHKSPIKPTISATTNGGLASNDSFPISPKSTKNSNSVYVPLDNLKDSKQSSITTTAENCTIIISQDSTEEAIKIPLLASTNHTNDFNDAGEEEALIISADHRN